MMMTQAHLVARGIAAILTIMTPVLANGDSVSNNWFSVTSVLHHNEALNGAHNVELSGNLASVPGKGGSIDILINKSIEIELDVR